MTAGRVVLTIEEAEALLKMLEDWSLDARPEACGFYMDEEEWLRSRINAARAEATGPGQ